MLEVSFSTAWRLALLFALSTWSSLQIAQRLPWHPRALEVGVPAAFGIALAPLLVGAAAIIALALLPGADPNFHFWFVAATTAVPSAFALIAPKAEPRQAASPSDSDSWFRLLLLVLILAAFVGFLLFQTTMMPLTQNDSLEYAMVGRVLFEQRHLGAYPVLDPDATASGFYGPWTHPPLYPVLIYLSYVAQGDADAASAMRFIAPWFALATTTVVYALGRISSRRVALLAATACLSPPLYLLGAGSALIDALPIHGMALVLCVLAALGGSWLIRGSMLGLVLGLALWTHSQAVLLVPISLVALFAVFGRAGLRDCFRIAAAALLVCVVIAAWPYLRNLQLYGSLISDTPIVFALPELSWTEYFRLSRGIDTLSERLQYGIFKGWFAVEAYGFFFWYSAFGIVAVLLGSYRRRHPASSETRRNTVCLVLVACYLGGVIASTALGIDLMIRNERYLLLLLAPAAVLAGVGVDALLGRPSERVATAASACWVAGVIVLGMLCIQLFVLANYRIRSLGLKMSELNLPFAAKIERWPAYRAVMYLRQRTAEDSLVLSMKPSDMFYADRRMLSYLDPRLVPFYRTIDPNVGWKLLRSLNVRYVHVPDYLLPPVYDSVLMSILGDPGLAKLVFSAGAYQIYELRGSDDARVAEPVEFGPNASEWTATQQLVIGGRKLLFGLTGVSEPMVNGAAPKPAFDVPVFLRDRTTWLESDGANGDEECSCRRSLAVEGGGEYLFEVGLRGRSFVRLWLRQYDAAGRLVDSGERIGEIGIDSSIGQQQFLRRLRFDPRASSIAMSVEYRGAGSVQVTYASVARIR